LSDEQQAEVDTWLDEKYPERKRQEEEIDYPLRDVPRVR
jgi:hypothetical protein